MQADQNKDPHPFGGGLFNFIIYLSFAAICMSMVMTVGDIILRLASQVAGFMIGVRPRWGLFGVVDLTQLALITAAPLAIAVAFFTYSHIRIDVFLSKFSISLQQAACLFSYVLGVFLTGICFWTAWNEMRNQLDFTTTSATLAIPYTWYWTPLLIGLGLSLIASLISVIRIIPKLTTKTAEPTDV